jgi:hypothetical protein
MVNLPEKTTIDASSGVATPHNWKDEKQVVFAL